MGRGIGNSEYSALARRTSWRRLTLSLGVTSLLLNVLGLAKGSLGPYNPPGLWPYLFWVPPLVIPAGMYVTGGYLLSKGKQWSQAVGWLWWLGVSAVLILNQILPRWHHLVQAVALALLGLIGYVGWKLGWGAMGYAPPEHAKYAPLSVALYAFLLLSSATFIAMVWFVPEASIIKFQDPFDYTLFRSISSVELLSSTALISAMSLKEILLPVFRTHQMIERTQDPEERSRHMERADVFICHASEDKDSFVRSLAHQLRKEGLYVWFDEFTLSIGDSLRRKIDQGLASSRYGIVVLSPAFFAKQWPQYELDGLLEQELARGKVILPIWHNVAKGDVLAYSPSLSDKLALPSTMPLEEISLKIKEVVSGPPEG